jgi:hypothetical protein
MMMRAMLPQSTRLRRLPAAAAVCLLALAAACTEDHLARRDGVTLEVGNAKAVNMVQTATDTMPASARRTTLSTGGQRMTVAIERYRNPPLPDATSDSGEASAETATPSPQ